MGEANSVLKGEITHWNISSSNDENESKSHINTILCAKTKEDMKLFEETEDCFILDFDPFDSVDISILSLASEKFNENDITTVAEKGQVACRDYAHSRHLCQKFPFATTLLPADNQGMGKANSTLKGEITHWNISSSDDETESKSRINTVLCAKRKEDMKLFEETEDCFILDFDPFDSVDISILSLASEKFNESDVAIVAEKGQVACRDYPHPRHLCQKFPFATTLHLTHCDKCYCYLCETVAPCESWALAEFGHCDATGNDAWKLLKRKMNKKP